MFLRKLLNILALMSIISNAFANDTTATVASGELQYQKTKQISMDKEVLKISLDKIEVNYNFFNHADHDLLQTVAFPLPILPYRGILYHLNWPFWDPDYIKRVQMDYNNRKDETSGRDRKNFVNALKTVPFMDFQIWVNGVRKPYKTEEKSFDANNHDITTLLAKNNIPLSVAYLSHFDGEPNTLDSDKKLKKTLKKLKLLEDTYGEPIWKTQTSFYWEQLFPKKQNLRSVHQYRPHPGFIWINPNINGNDFSIDSDDNEKNLKEFCVSASDLEILSKYIKNKKVRFFNAYRIDYILTTGANWRGPIKKFRLEITPPKTAITTIFCSPGKIEDTASGKLIIEANDFTPKKDLKILFVEIPRFDTHGSQI